MTEPFDPWDPFETLRSSARAAAVPSAWQVRELGRRRRVQARVVAGVGAVVLMTSSLGVAAAVSNHGGLSPLTPGGDVTSSPSPSLSTLRPPPSPRAGATGVGRSLLPPPVRSLRPPPAVMPNGRIAPPPPVRPTPVAPPPVAQSAGG